MNVLQHFAALLPHSDAVLRLLGDVAGITLSLFLAYLAYAIAHHLADLLADKEHRVWKLLRKACRAVVDVLIYVIAALYGLEYLMMKVQHLA